MDCKHIYPDITCKHLMVEPDMDCKPHLMAKPDMNCTHLMTEPEMDCKIFNGCARHGL